MKSISPLVLFLAVVAVSGTGLADANIYIGGTSGTVVRIRVNSDDSSMSAPRGSYLESMLRGFDYLTGLGFSATSQREPCPNVQLGANSGLELSIEVDGQDCSGYQNSSQVSFRDYFCPEMNLKAVSGSKVFVTAIERRQSKPSERKSGSDCPGISITASSGVHITIRLSNSHRYGPFKGINLDKRSGVNINMVVNLGDCPVPSISMNQVSRTIVRIHDGFW